MKRINYYLVKITLIRQVIKIRFFNNIWKKIMKKVYTFKIKL